MAHAVSLFRYPIKGFEGEKLECVPLEYGKGFPGDRAVAITRSGTTAGAARINSSRPIRRLSIFSLAKAWAQRRSMKGSRCHVEIC